MGSQQLPVLTPLRLSARGRRQAALLKAWSLRLAETLQLWRERRRQRRKLGALSDHMLKDMGLSRADAGRETGKRFWEG